MDLNKIIAAVQAYKEENGEWPDGYLEVLPNGKIKKAQGGKKTAIHLGFNRKNKKDKEEVLISSEKPSKKPTKKTVKKIEKKEAKEKSVKTVKEKKTKKVSKSKKKS